MKFERVHIVAHSFGGSEATASRIFTGADASVVYLDPPWMPPPGSRNEDRRPKSTAASGSPYAQVLHGGILLPDVSKMRCTTLAFYAYRAAPPFPNGQ